MKTPKKVEKSNFIDFDDSSIPIGKRKVAFVKWLMSKQDKSLREARLLCHYKFYKEERSR
jgi:hypothetical protein